MFTPWVEREKKGRGGIAREEGKFDDIIHLLKVIYHGIEQRYFLDSGTNACMVAQNSGSLGCHRMYLPWCTAFYVNSGVSW